MIFYRYRTCDFIIREWDTTNIKFDAERCAQRIKCINTITRNSAELSLIFDKVDNIYFSISNRIEKRFRRKLPTKNLLLKLAEDIDFYHTKNLIHGDIKYSNTIIGNQVIYLIDWEPILEYSINGKYIFRSTMPYISSSDILNRRISSNTDKIGFYFLCLRLLNKWEKIQRQNVLEIENLIKELTCTEIIKKLNTPSREY
jgi:serine/threonine protein kinase